MKIIRINPLAVQDAKEKLIRVLTFANGSYALQYVNPRGESLLDLFDTEGNLIKKGAVAESAYIFKNGNYILLFPPTNHTAKAGGFRYRREYIMYSRKGNLIFDNIDYFTPMSDDWVVLHQDGRQNLYNNNLKLIDGGRRCDFVKFDYGYARVTPRTIPEAEASPLMPGDVGKWLPYNCRLKALYQGFANKRDGLTFDWTFCNEQGHILYQIENGLIAFGGGYSMAMYHDGHIFFHYPDGTLGAETSLYSGCRKNIACLVNLSATKMNPEISKGETIINYRMGHETEHHVCLPYELQKATDFYEFSNGNFSCVLEDKLCFFKEGGTEPMVSVPKDEKIYFTPDGKYWNETTQTLHAPSGEELNNHVTGFIDYGDWYLIDRQGSHTVYDLDGKIIAGNAHVLRKINGILFVRVENGQIGLLHRSGKAILPPFAEWHLKLEETVF